LDSLLQHKDVNRALRIIMDFREILEIDPEQVQVERTDLSLGLLVSQVVETLRPAAGEKEVDLAASAPAEEELVVWADWDRTLRALTCLLRSLIYAVPGKSGIFVRIRDAGDGITVEIQSNDAIGAVRKIHQAMEGFDSFGGHSDPHGDLVLGLFVAKSLVELYGGTMDIDGASPQGDILSITLPKPGRRPETLRPSVPGRTGIRLA
jgi:signal transduction histidine kinase